MASEQEELKLTVTLVDNASAGVAALKNQIQSLTSGQTKASFDTFQRQQKEMGEQIKSITSLAFGGEKALLGFIGKFGALGLAASAGISGLKGIADSLNNINRAAQTLGVPAANIKNIADQLARFGISAQEATELVAGVTKASV